MNKKSVQQKEAKETPLVVIVGPTASGKSALAMKLAGAYNGELICADSRTIYKGMDIGTAKPSKQDQQEIKHWGLDLVEPGERFTAADFKYFAQQKIADIRQRGKLPIVVGGTGLYIDGLIFDYDFVETDAALRDSLDAMTLEELHKYCSINNISLPENQLNRRHVIAAILRKNVSGKRLDVPIANTIIVGITTKPEELRRRIEARAAELFENGMVQEALSLGETYGWDSEAMTGNIYRLVRQFEQGELDAAELQERNAIADWQLAKRQLTWFRRNNFIAWKDRDEAFTYISSELAKTGHASVESRAL